jgi:hypothetical protein
MIRLVERRFERREAEMPKGALDVLAPHPVRDLRGRTTERSGGPDRTVFVNEQLTRKTVKDAGRSGPTRCVGVKRAIPLDAPQPDMRRLNPAPTSIGHSVRSS